jgi:lycopene epsilon-cyclase
LLQPPHTFCCCLYSLFSKHRLVTLASGQAAGRFLRYEAGAPTVAAQTAYGIEAEVEGYNDAYDSASMLFMDYRRHHSGLWDGAARYLEPGGLGLCNSCH